MSNAALPLEIERSYLLRGAPTFPARAEIEALSIVQGYLPEAPPPECPPGRLRSVVRPDGTTIYFHTVKTGTGLVRTEVERRIDRKEFDALWPHTAGRRLAKTRYRVAEGERVWEIDRFHGIDLVLAEVELPTPDATVEIPPWLAPLVVREVTDEPEYRNSQIALRVHQAVP
ncbi:MAG: hypothetical protein KDA22_09480 [Phycisphaerales bacterium]|nr:hypothetical protein [Phycisphaerales bacterium]